MSTYAVLHQEFRRYTSNFNYFFKEDGIRALNSMGMIFLWDGINGSSGKIGRCVKARFDKGFLL